MGNNLESTIYNKFLNTFETHNLIAYLYQMKIPCHYDSSDLIFSNQVPNMVALSTPMSTTLSKVFPVIFKETTKEYPVVETPLDQISTCQTCGIVGSPEPSVTRPFSGNGVTGSSDLTGPNVKLVEELDLQTSIIYLIQTDYNLFIYRNLFYHI